MVKQSQRISQQTPSFSEHSKGISSSIKYAMSSAFTINPMDLSNLPESYSPGCFYALIISLEILIVELFYYSMIYKSDNDKLYSVVAAFFPLFLIRAILLIIFGYLASATNSYILGKNKSGKDLLVFMSSLTYVPLMKIIEFIADPIARILSFGLFIINAFYLTSTFNSRSNQLDQRLYIIHYACIIISYMILQFIATFSIRISS